MTLYRAKRMRQVRLFLFGGFIAVAALLLACNSGPDTSPGAVHVLTTDGVVNPVMDRYIDRGIGAAENREAAAVVIRLDTPGGLLSSMDDIIQTILASEVPVIVYVSPSGGQAASAGTYITYAAHVAAMSPATVIGSATPISGTGADLEGDLRNKVIENSVEKIRDLAALRGRNADWAEDAVRKGISAPSSEAVGLNIVEYIADDLDDLLQQIDGQSVELQGGEEVVLETAGAEVAFNNRNLVERFLDVLADPNIAFLLLSLGSLALFIELFNPGSIVPGVFGVIALVMAFFSLSVIPFNWAGVALIMFAFILFGLELFVTSGGVLGVGGAVALVLGGLMLTSGNDAEFRVSEELIIAVAIGLGAMVMFVFVNVMRIRTMPAKVGMSTFVGRTVVARSALAPEGFVMMDGEIWTAEAEEGEIKPGDNVIITQIKGLRLKVRKQKPEGD
ncbi:MAG: nodulation protein NfeD [Chloroflexi bacterium]|nr:nodulation protein NfeD [Chloroflexota bacterium]MCI0843673.1 nodulation protein NfeD [Chloroflexota bacterium]MCI0884365.1 nodulation protein NfeD [Chloroflexota bacterium]MCI0885807.1 nodulation protein NfeD [Chloroflexota bacterium]